MVTTARDTAGSGLRQSAFRASSMASPGSRDSVAAELAVERPAREAEPPGGLDALAAGGLQRTEDLLAFRGLQREIRHLGLVGRDRRARDAGCQDRKSNR